MANEPEPKYPMAKLRTNIHDHLHRTPGEKQPGGPMRGPGHLSLYTATHKALLAVAQMRGTPVNKVECLRAANIEGDMRVWLYPTDHQDPDRLPLIHYRSKLSVNLSKVLTHWNLALPTGQRRQYDLHIDPNSPVGPALVLHLDKPLEIKWVKRAKKGETPATQAAPATQPDEPETDDLETDEPETEPTSSN